MWRMIIVVVEDMVEVQLLYFQDNGCEFEPHPLRFSAYCKPEGKLDRCRELTPDVPRVEETHKSHTKGSFTPPFTTANFRSVVLHFGKFSQHHSLLMTCLVTEPTGPTNTIHLP